MNKENKSKNISPFCGEKYSVWKFRVKALLAENDVLFVIEKEKPQEIDEIWKKAERSAKGVIIEFLSDSFLSFADNNSTAKEIFEKLDSIYERKSLATQLSVRKQLLTFKLNSDTPLIIHFNKFDELICELISSGAKIEEVDKVAHLLLTLPSIYDGVVTAIETLSAEHVTLSFVKNRLLDHETKIKNISRDTSNKVLQAISPNDNKQKALHLKSNFKAKSSKNFKFNLKCHHCGRKGHLKKDCFFFKKVLENKDEEKQAQVANVVDQVETGRSFAFMLRQGRNNIGDADISFILDSGASDHMINNINLFSTYSTLDTPIEIAIAKQGAYIYASAKGTVQLCSDRNTNITLENVLFCKEVPQNLLSVRKMQAAGLTVEFNSKGIRISKNGQEILEEYIPTEHQVADVLTKPLPAARFLTLRHEMGLKN